MSQFRCRGIIPPVITPLGPDDELDLASLRKLVQYLIDGGVDGLWVLGATGQFYSLTETQRDQVTETALEAAAGAVPVLVGCIDTGPQRSVERARRAQAAGADAVFATAPIYDVVTQVEIVNYFQAIRQGVDIPVIAYDAEYATQTPLAIDTVVRLAEDGTISGLKHSSDPTAMRRIIEATSHLEEFGVVTGHTYQVDAAMLAGAHGAVPVMANLIPGIYARIYKAAIAQDWVAAAELQVEALRYEALVQTWDPGGAVFGVFFGATKTALKELGIIDHARAGAPYPDATDEQRDRIRGILEDLGATVRSG